MVIRGTTFVERLFLVARGNLHTEFLQVVQLTKFDYRLANDLDEDLQKMRCRVNYHALRFTKPIEELGQKLVMRMQSMAKRFIAVHLRFVPSIKSRLFLFSSAPHSHVKCLQLKKKNCIFIHDSYLYTSIHVQ